MNMHHHTINATKRRQQKRHTSWQPITKTAHDSHKTTNTHEKKIVHRSRNGESKSSASKCTLNTEQTIEYLHIHIYISAHQCI